MRLELHPHPGTPCEAVSAIVAQVSRAAGRLTLRYELAGQPARLLLPPPAASTRVDGLWKHTCFEAFARPAGGEAYCEFNLAPSGQWAAYRFDGYRAGMAALEIAAPHIELRPGDDGLVLSAALALEGGAALQLGLSAVIEEAGGRISYWALAHPPGRPDFHHADCFAAELPALQRP